MYSPDNSPSETISERLTPIEQLQDFNTSEKSKNLKELATQGINTIKSFFNRINIKNTIHSFLQKNNDTKISEHVSNQDKTPINENAPDFQHNQETNQVKDYIVLKTLDNIESTLMQSEISDYYHKTSKHNIHSFLHNKNVPKEKIDTATDAVLQQLSQKRIQEFKKSVTDKLKDTELSEKEFAKFWAWRIAHPPKEKPLLIRTSTGIKIKYDEFASDQAINDFLSNHISTLSEDFFDGLKTSSDLEKDIEQALAPFSTKIDNQSQQSDQTDSKLLAYNIEKRSNGWVNASMYEKVANLPAGKALYMLGSINSELKPTTRKLLDKMRHLIDSQNTTQTFESLVQQILNKTNDNPPSEITLKALSDTVNKLNKVITLSKEK